jgi:transposase-like protein
LELDLAIQAKEDIITNKRDANYLNLSWIDEPSIREGSDFVWLWVALEPTDRTILGIRISIEKNMLVAEQFIQSLIKRCDTESTIFQ